MRGLSVEGIYFATYHLENLILPLIEVVFLSLFDCMYECSSVFLDFALGSCFGSTLNVNVCFYGFRSARKCSGSLLEIPFTKNTNSNLYVPNKVVAESQEESVTVSDIQCQIFLKTLQQILSLKM